MKNQQYTIIVESFLRTDVLGEEFVLPYSEELNEAVLLINKLCGQLVDRHQKDSLELFLIEKNQQLKAIEGSDRRRILMEIYYKDRK